MTMGTEFKPVGLYEKIQQGDQYFDTVRGSWHCCAASIGYTPASWAFGFKVRRPFLPAWFPQWRQPGASGCPVHVLWAESPSTVRTVAQVAAEAKPKPVEPGTGYRMLEPGEIILNTDERLRDGKWASVASGAVGMNKLAAHLPMRRKLPAPLCPMDPPAGYYILGPDEVWREGDFIGDGVDGRWEPLMSYNFGTTTNTWARCKEPRWCCRKLPVPAPEYRPYANAAEAAAGLQGKLIRHTNSEIWHTVTQIDWAGATVAEDRISFSGLQKYWKFTDGTPCAVLITNQGTK